MVPQFFADHIGNLTVELVLASVEISTLLIRVPPTLETLAVLMEAEAFPGNEPEGDYDQEIIFTTISEINSTQKYYAKYCCYICTYALDSTFSYYQTVIS